MRKSLRMTVVAGIALTLVVSAMVTMAQNQGNRRGGGFDPAQMRAMMLEQIQQQLGASADEWKALEPLVTNVMDKQRAASSGMRGMMRMFGPGGPGGQPGQGGGPGAPGGQPGQGGGGPNADRPPRDFRGEPDPDVEALQAALDKQDTPAEDIKAKLTALRTSRTKKEAELKTAREELRKVLTVRQEAQMVLRGILD
jgi:hypothetical protein